MEAGIAHLARQPGNRDEFFSVHVRKFHPACQDNFVVVTLF
jgi:hypothetical protein